MPGPPIRTLLDATAPNNNSKMQDAITREAFQIGANRPPPSTRRRSLGLLVDMDSCFAKSFTVATLGSSTARGLMRSIHYKHYALSDLQWLVVPPMLSGQCAVMEATAIGKKAPVAVALWASASDEVDKRLSENLNIPIRLRPDEWRSGGVLWLIDAVSDPKRPATLAEAGPGDGFQGARCEDVHADEHGAAKKNRRLENSDEHSKE